MSFKDLKYPGIIKIAMLCPLDKEIDEMYQDAAFAIVRYVSNNSLRMHLADVGNVDISTDENGNMTRKFTLNHVATCGINSNYAGAWEFQGSGYDPTKKQNADSMYPVNSINEYTKLITSQVFAYEVAKYIFEDNGVKPVALYKGNRYLYLRRWLYRDYIILWVTEDDPLYNEVMEAEFSKENQAYSCLDDNETNR